MKCRIMNDMWLDKFKTHKLNLILIKCIILNLY